MDTLGGSGLGNKNAKPGRLSDTAERCSVGMTVCDGRGIPAHTPSGSFESRLYFGERLSPRSA